MVAKQAPVKVLPRTRACKRGKVKSGCKTCKIRKVKCDEGRPACKRCLSTGRVCDGYGIWGGGGNSYNSCPSFKCNETIAPRFPALVKVSNAVEGDCLQWFIIRTATKLPGVFESSFWTTLVLPAAFSEPAVLHAVMALSFAHRGESLRWKELNSNHERCNDGLLNDQEVLALRHYNKAIHQLEPHFLAKTRSSVRVALVACIMFVSLEFLRGNYYVGNKHLQNGMRVLSSAAAFPDNISNGSVRLHETADDLLSETMGRLNLQATLFGQGSMDIDANAPGSDAQILPAMFTFMAQARSSLDQLLSRIILLTETCAQGSISTSRKYSAKLLATQQRIKKDLGSWSRTFTVSRVPLQVDKGIIGVIPYKLLRLYHTMGAMMADTCVYPDDESCWDSHTGTFLQMIKQTIDLWTIILSADLTGTPFHHTPDMTPYIADFGLMPPLFLVATKCRIHQLRLQAIELIGAVGNREGMWDSDLIAAIAREVVRIEECGIKDDASLDRKISLQTVPLEQDLAIPLVPNSNRVHRLKVTLPETSTKHIILTGQRKHGNGTWQSIYREYDTSTRLWQGKPVMELGGRRYYHSDLSCSSDLDTTLLACDMQLSPSTMS